jgi:chromosome segregation ATPase
VLPNSNTQAPAKQDENKLISTPKENIKESIKENTTAPNEKLKTNNGELKNKKILNEKIETESEKLKMNNETLKTNNKTLKPESKALKPKAKKEKITFNPVSGRFAHLDESFLKRLRETFPRANVEMEIRKAELWLYANPTKRKSNYERFLINWLSRAEKGGSSGKIERYIAISEEDHNPNGKPFSARAGEW